VRRLTLWLLLFCLTAAIVVPIALNDHGTIGSLTGGDLGSLLAKVAMLVFLSGAVITLARENISKALEHTVLWCLILGLLVVCYAYRSDLRTIGQRVLAELVPGHAVTNGRVVGVARGRSGDFQIGTEVNGAKVPMVLDTGASVVMLTHEAAKAAGLPVDMVKYDVAVDTANGRAQVAEVTLDRIGVGGLVEKSVRALIAPPGQLKISLLGRSFLNRLESWQVQGDRLTMRGYP
jgi:aspartyl protease family protein